MKRLVPGLAETARDSRPEIPDGIFLVRVDGAQFRWHAKKPLYVLRFSIVEPATFASQTIVGRLYCTQKAMWKLGWFLRDFLYDPELLAHEQVDEKALPGLRGVVKISHVVVNGISLINLDGFAPASHGSGSNFLAYVDAIGELDGTPCVLEWKTTSARYPEEPAGISALDPQLICYSWMTGMDEVAQVVFVRKRLVEVQYLRSTITEAQRQEFAALVEDTVGRIESGLFLPHSGIRFPQNPCTTCPFLGLCLDKRDLVEAALVRKPGVDLGLFDELVY